MDLEQAINHCADKVKELWNSGCKSCAVEHTQLLLWLMELSERRDADNDKR